LCKNDRDEQRANQELLHHSYGAGADKRTQANKRKKKKKSDGGVPTNGFPRAIINKPVHNRHSEGDLRPSLWEEWGCTALQLRRSNLFSPAFDRVGTVNWRITGRDIAE
jgi:hypothetical protein